MDTLTDKDRRILEFIRARQVASQSDLSSFLGLITTEAIILQLRNLIDGGYISMIRPLGQTSFTLTKKGIRVLLK